MIKGILLIGMPGCGKSTLGRLLADELGYDFIDMDKHIEEKEGISVKEIFASKGEDFFRKKESEACEELSKLSKVVIASGGGAVKASGNIEFFNEYLTLFINRPLELILEDVDTESRPLLQDGKERLTALYRERIDLYRNYGEEEVINDGPIEAILKEMVNKVKAFSKK